MKDKSFEHRLGGNFMHPFDIVQIAPGSEPALVHLKHKRRLTQLFDAS